MTLILKTNMLVVFHIRRCSNYNCTVRKPEQASVERQSWTITKRAATEAILYEADMADEFYQYSWYTLLYIING
jgi:hypothetical protein